MRKSFGNVLAMADSEGKLGTLRVVLAFGLAPVVPGFVAGIMEYGDGLMLWYIQFSAALGYSTAFLVGLPIYFLLVRRKKLNKLKHFVVFGVLMGVCAYVIPSLPALIITFDARIIETMANGWAYLLLGVFFGTIATVSFWAIAFLRLR